MHAQPFGTYRPPAIRISAQIFKRAARHIFINAEAKFSMFSEYIEAALEKAVYRTIDDEVPIFVSVPELQGAWATGKTIEEARKELISVLEGWIALRLRMRCSIPPIGGHAVRE
jgi:predicted RNase H-like HicB family nuclease